MLSCGVNFFVTLYMHSMEQQHSLILIRKKREAETDTAIHTISRSILALDHSIAILKEAITQLDVRTPSEYAKYEEELKSSEMQRADLQYLLTALRGRLDVDKLLFAVKTITNNIGLQLHASAYINRQVLTLAVQRDLDDAREPVTQASVAEAYRRYDRATAGVDVV